MASLIPRAVALRQKTNKQKLIEKSNSQLETIDQPTLEEIQLPTNLLLNVPASEPIKSVQLKEDDQTLSRKTNDLRHPTYFKNEPKYRSSSRGDQPLKTYKPIYSIPIYKSHPRSSRTHSSGYHDQKKSKDNLFPIGRIVWLTGLPEVRFNKVQVLELIFMILQIDGTDDDEISLKNQTSLIEKKINREVVVKYVDLQKGLDHCHIRFSHHQRSQQFLLCLDRFLKSKPSSVSLTEKGDSYDFSKLKGILLNGRREEIYWEKIPLHLYH
ncbi:hypothetical protein DFH28DRAFT_1126135 [Melampsora americana]|nr:hypothetical protein DFH28DRAFT_1126135 [Melampsora americana]